MEDSDSERQESTDGKIIEDIYQLEKSALGDGAAVCETCGEKFLEGAPVVVFAVPGRALTRKPCQRPVVQANNADHEGPSESDLGSKDGETAETTAPHAAAGADDDGDEGCGDAGDDVDTEVDLDELQPVSTSLRTALEQEGGAGRPEDAAGGGR